MSPSLLETFLVKLLITILLTSFSTIPLPPITNNAPLRTLSSLWARLVARAVRPLLRQVPRLVPSWVTQVPPLGALPPSYPLVPLTLFCSPLTLTLWVLPILPG